jgi:hypothetical protein
MTINYKEDTALLIEDWDTKVIIGRQGLTYNDRGEASVAWASVEAAYVDIQPANFLEISNQEAGMKERTSHIAYGYYSTTGSKLNIWAGDRLYDCVDKSYDVINGTYKAYEVLCVNEFTDSHFEIFCRYIEGSGGTIVATNFQTTFIRDKFDGDDVTVNFSTTTDFIEDSTMVFLDGILQEEGTGKDYTEDADFLGITFTHAPSTGEKIEVRYIEDLS